MPCSWVRANVGLDPMPEWDAAGEAVATNAANWFAWCDRHGWGLTDPYNHKFWTRKQFRAALAVMPKKHPDRWKFEVGAKWAIADSGGAFAVAIILTIVVGVVSIPLSISSGLFIWAVTWPTILLLWGLYIRRRYRVLSA